MSGRDLIPGMRYFVKPFDAVGGLRTIPDETIPLVITDPAYESLEKHRAKGTTTRLKVSDASSNEWFPIFKNERFPELFTELYRVMAKNSHLYMFTDATTMFVVKPIAEAAGFTFWKPIVWDKGSAGLGYHYRGQYEFVLFFEKGKRKLANLATPDVLQCKRVRKAYPTEKPRALSRIFIEQSSDPGDIVIDPFMGSASVGVAALETGRKFIGYDVKKSAVELAKSNLDSAVVSSGHGGTTATSEGTGKG